MHNMHWTLHYLFSAACDQNFISTTNIKSKNGTFVAPNFLNPEGHVRQCTYNFRALPGNFWFQHSMWTVRMQPVTRLWPCAGERVQVLFEQFSLEGTPPEWVAVLQTIHRFHNWFSQSRRRPLLGPFPGWKCLLVISHLRHYAKRVLTPRSLNVKLGPRRKGHKGRAGCLA